MRLEDFVRDILVGKTIKAEEAELPLLVKDICIAGDIYQDGVVYLNPDAERYGLAFDEEFEVIR